MKHRLPGSLLAYACPPLVVNRDWSHYREEGQRRQQQQQQQQQPEQQPPCRASFIWRWRTLSDCCCRRARCVHHLDTLSVVSLSYIASFARGGKAERASPPFQRFPGCTTRFVSCTGRRASAFGMAEDPCRTLSSGHTGLQPFGAFGTGRVVTSHRHGVYRQHVSDVRGFLSRISIILLSLPPASLDAHH